MHELILMGVMVTIFFAFYGTYHLGYSKGRLIQIDRLVGTITRQDAVQLTKALEKLCDYTECVANGKTIGGEKKAVHH